MDTLIAMILLGIVAFAAIALGVSKLIEWRWGVAENDDAPTALQPPAVDYVAHSAPVPVAAICVSQHTDAVKETAEIGKPAGPAPAELDRMLADARAEAVARAVGTLAGAGLLAPNSRSKVLLALGIEGRRYQLLKPVVDAAQAAAQSEAQTAQQSLPSAPPILVNAGRPDERSVDRGTAP